MMQKCWYSQADADVTFYYFTSFFFPRHVMNLVCPELQILSSVQQKLKDIDLFGFSGPV